MNDNLNNLNDFEFCSKRTDKNNIELFLKLTPSKETNSLNFACVNLLINNIQTITGLLNLQTENLNKLLSAIPSEMKTLLCLENFNKKLDDAIRMNPSGITQYEIIKNFDYSEKSNYLKSITFVPALNNASLNQTVFEF